MRLAGGRLSLRVRPRSVAVALLLTALASAAGLVALTRDGVVTPTEVREVLTGGGSAQAGFVVLELRLPRVALGLVVGAALGAAGALFQQLSRNPLGSPDIVGFNSGAATGALLTLLHGDPSLVPLGAAGGGLLTAAVVQSLAVRGRVRGNRLILVGIGVGALLTSVNSYLLTRAELAEAQSAQLWLIGSLGGADRSQLPPAALATAALLAAALPLVRRLDLLEMGDDSAGALGIPVGRLRLLVLLVAVGLSAVAVSAAGPIVFVALAAPQLARRLTRGTGTGLLPATAMGALLLSAADLLTLHLPTAGPLPVGVVTGGVGGLYLGWLLGRRGR
ncbi:iron chelate uptake ABC transporter family permease subunit [Streptomyces sp. LP05-1]|uniref:Iron chelate uptake ABC transporter family permease subunit n=1 Tax=Streptomyces pyxinae TaxID=2970734 RepID=A0ABT2CC88_9ACTN|nr:iron chelate uptake ABC transporter family permease subunit [Streptomyces sp. LP05-1]MCS0635032.1 iron chelate uptake ABC transporter family permease subunit [Streptomyces sp. LP05-1]